MLTAYYNPYAFAILATKRGPQVTVVRNMISRLLGDHNNFLNYEGPSTKLQLEGSRSSYPIQLEAQSVEPARAIFTETSSLYGPVHTEDKNVFAGPKIISAFEEPIGISSYI